jgi:hypothetical protein
MADATRTVWAWGVWCASRLIREADCDGHFIPVSCFDAVNARFDWLQGKRSIGDLQSFVGPVRQFARFVSGMDTRGHPVQGKRRGPQIVVDVAWRCLHLVQTDWRRLAARDAGWFETAQGQQEAQDLERRLWKLRPQTAMESQALVCGSARSVKS